MVKTRKYNPETLKQRANKSYEYNIDRVKHGFLAYTTGRTVLVSNKQYLPDTFREMFKRIKFNPETKSFEFHFKNISINKSHVEMFNFEVSSYRESNFLNLDRYSFRLIRISYIFQDSIIPDKIILKEKSTRYELMKSFYDLLNQDGTLEYIYNLSIEEKKAKSFFEFIK